jgi:hypothetical protein
MRKQAYRCHIKKAAKRSIAKFYHRSFIGKTKNIVKHCYWAVNNMRLFIFQYICGLAIKCFTDGFKRAETSGLCFAGFED